MALIQIEGMEFYAFHGCFAEEQIIGNKFIVDVSFEYDSLNAEQSDNLKNTVDYQDVYHTISRVMLIKSKLLEHVCRRILEELIVKFPLISNISVKVSKCHPPIGGKVNKVSITLKN